MTTKFQHGDLVSIEGYPRQIFYVDAMREITEYPAPDTAYNYVEYELTDAINGHWYEAFEEDLALVCRAAYAEDYLRDFDIADYPEGDAALVGAEVYYVIEGGESVVNRKKADRHKELVAKGKRIEKRVKTEIVDGMLDELNAAKESSDAEKAAEIKGRLAKYTAE